MSSSFKGGSSTMFALTLLKNWRIASTDPKLTGVKVADGQVWIKDELRLLGVFRYFVKGKVEFPEQVGTYMVIGHVTQMDPKAIAKAFPTNATDPQQYDFVCDIEVLIPVEGVDMRLPPWLICSGQATNINTKTDSFDIQPYQYSNILRESRSMPINAVIQDSPRFKDGKKPVPQEDTIVQIQGPLNDVHYKTQGDPDIVEQFGLDIKQIAFLGKPASGSSAGSVPSTPSRKNKRGFEFDYNSPTSSPTKKYRNF